LTRAFHTIFSHIVVELWDVCNGKTCSRTNAGADLKFKCKSHDKVNGNYSVIDYCVHNLEIEMCLLSNPVYFSDRDKISDCSVSALVEVVT
jgi:hypothetical protein